VSVVSQLVYNFLCLASPKGNPQVPCISYRAGNGLEILGTVLSQALHCTHSITMKDCWQCYSKRRMRLQNEESKLALERECLLNLMQDSPHLPRCFAQVVDAAGVPSGMAVEYLDGGDLHHALA